MRGEGEPRRQEAHNKPASILPETVPCDPSLSAALSRLTPELRGAGGYARSSWQQMRPAPSRSSDLVGPRLHLFVKAGGSRSQSSTAPTAASAKPTVGMVPAGNPGGENGSIKPPVNMAKPKHENNPRCGFRCDHLVRSTPALEMVRDAPLLLPQRTRRRGMSAAARKYPAMQPRSAVTAMLIRVRWPND